MRRTKSSLQIVLLTVCFASVAVSPTAIQAYTVNAPGQGNLYEVGSLAAEARSEAAIEERVITVLPQALNAATEELELELLSGVQVVARRDLSTEIRSQTDLTWRGLIEDTYRVTLTRQGNLVAGFFDTAIGPHSILPRGRGLHTLALLDQALFGNCGIDGSESSPPKVAPVQPDLRDLAHDSTSETASPANPIHVAILAIYTPQARQKAGGISEVAINIQAAIDQGNSAFIDSESGMRFQLAHSAEVDYQDSGNSLADIAWMEGSSEVAILRDAVAADLVGMMVGDLEPGICGEATSALTEPGGNPRVAFQVTELDCAVDNRIFAHEFGHLVGMNHDPGQVDPDDAIFPFAFGHFDVPAGFRTVMSREGDCEFGCLRVGHFSNPDVNQNGAPTGIAGQRDNAQVADRTADAVSKYRTIPISGPALVASYVPGPGIPRRETVSQSPNPASFSFYYDDIGGNFDERPGGPCNDGHNNSTYLKLRYEGPPMASCSYQLSYGENTNVINCTPAVLNWLNTHPDVLIRTDRYVIDIDPGSPNFCDRAVPTTDFLRFNQAAWIRLNLTTTSGLSVSRQVNFVKVLEGLP